jgi:hypothetical protein
MPELGGETGIAQTQLESLLEALQRRDLLAIRGNTLEYAYPFTVRDVGHHVHVHGHTLNALCAIDALGVGAMCNTDVTIESSCSACGASVRLTTERCGRHLATISPPDVVVWYEFSSYCNTAASSCCPAISFYCCEDHLRNSRPDRSGSSLMAVEALEVGRALFAPIMAEPKPHAA